MLHSYLIGIHLQRSRQEKWSANTSDISIQLVAVSLTPVFYPTPHIDPGLGDIHSLPLYTCLGNMNIHELTMIAGILLSRKAPFHVLGINILYFFHIHSSRKEVASIWICQLGTLVPHQPYQGHVTHGFLLLYSCLSCVCTCDQVQCLVSYSRQIIHGWSISFLIHFDQLLKVMIDSSIFVG